MVGRVDAAALGRHEEYGIEAALLLIGLDGRPAMLFGYRISKREQRSNWAREKLTPSQITYAATDAAISRELFRRLEMMRLERQEVERPLGSARDTMA